MKNLVSVLLVLAIVTGTVFAQGGNEKVAVNKKGLTEIKVGTMPNHIGVPIKYAIEQGWYEEAGIDVNLIIFPTGAPINEALSAEQVDLAGTGGAGVFALAAGDCYWLGDYIRTIDGLGVYVRPDSPILKHEHPDNPKIKGSRETIEGITILGALGTTDQFEATCWVQNFGLTGNDVSILNMERGPAVQAFKTGEGDAIACGGPPYNFELEKAGCIEVGDITDVSGVYIDDGLIGRKKFVDANENLVQKFVEVTYRAIDAMAESDELLHDFAMKFYNDNGKDYNDKMMRDEIASKDYLGKRVITSPEYRFGSAMVGMSGFYVSDGKIEADMQPNIAAALRPDFLEKVYGVKITKYSDK